MPDQASQGRQSRQGHAVKWAVPIAAVVLVAGAIASGPVIAAVQGIPCCLSAPPSSCSRTPPRPPDPG